MLFSTRVFLLFSFPFSYFRESSVFFFRLFVAYVVGPVSLHANRTLVVRAGLKFHKQLHSPTEEIQFCNIENPDWKKKIRASILFARSPVTDSKHRSTLRPGSPSLPFPLRSLQLRK
jgi:hypothetical protein